jgi:hypothetical protein
VPSSRSLFTADAIFITLRIASLRFVTTAFGVAAGARTPTKVEAS